MTVKIDGTTGVTTPGVANSGNETITGTLAVTGGATAASLQVGGVSTNLQPLVSGAIVASTSGTSIDFTSIPSWVKRITVLFAGVSTSGSSRVQVQVGAGSVATSGYSSYGVFAGNTSTTGITASNGFVVDTDSPTSSALRNGSIVICTQGSNVWVESGQLVALDTVPFGLFSAGNIILGGTLDRVRITTVNGTDTFDAGFINILYE